MATKKVKVDFGGVESRGGKKGSGGRKHYKAGDYAVKVKKVVAGKSGGDGDEGKPRLEVMYVFTTGKLKGNEIRDDLYLTEKSLWRLRQALEAMKIKVPNKAVNLDIDTMRGKTCAITIEDEEYESKLYSKVVDTFLLSELEDDEADEDEDDDDEEDDEDEADDEDDDEDDDEEEDEDLEEVDLDDI